MKTRGKTQNLETILAVAQAYAKKIEEEKKYSRAQRYTQDIEPQLENLINCCRENHTQNLQLILDNHTQEIIASPDKILNAYLNYSTTGHDEILDILNNFVQKNNLKIEDKNFECAYYLIFQQKEKEFVRLLSSGIWDRDKLKKYMLSQITVSTKKEKADFIQKMLVEREKHILENGLKNTVFQNTKTTFKI